VFAILGGVLDLFVPDVGKFEDLCGEVDSRGGQVAGRVLHEAVLDQSELDEVSGHHVGFLVGAEEFGESLEEEVRAREGDVEVEFFEHLALHLENLLLRVGLVSDVDKISQIRWVNFFILAGGEKRGDAHQLEFLPTHLCLF